MTSANDYPDELPARLRIDDGTAEDLLAGRPVALELQPVAAALQALREAAEQPVCPTPPLAMRMAAGITSGNGAGTATGAVDRPRHAVAGGSPPRTARRAFAAAAAVAGAAGRVSLAGRLAAAGLAAALVGVGTAGFAGTLPDPVQDRFETVVESVTPYQFPDRVGAGRPGDPGEDRGAGDGTGDGGGDRGRGDDGVAEGPVAPPERGDGVSEDARDGGVDGQEVSDEVGAAGDPPADRPDERPADRPDERPGVRPDERPGVRPDERPADRSGVRVDERSDERPADRSGVRPDERPDERPVDRPGVRPDQPPADRPGDRPGDLSPPAEHALAPERRPIAPPGR